MGITQAEQQPPDDAETKRHDIKKIWGQAKETWGQAWLTTMMFIAMFTKIWWNPWQGNRMIKGAYILASVLTAVLAVLSWHQVFVLRRRRDGE